MIKAFHAQSPYPS